MIMLLSSVRRHHQARDAAHLAPRIRHPSAPGGLRHPHDAGSARPRRCGHHHDLHARAEGGRWRGSQSDRFDESDLSPEIQIVRGTLEGKSGEEDRDDTRVYMVSTRAQLTQRLICNLLICGADSRNRTRDLLITNRFYLVSHNYCAIPGNNKSNI